MFAFSLQRRARVAADAPPATPPTITIVKFCFVIFFLFLCPCSEAPASEHTAPEAPASRTIGRGRSLQCSAFQGWSPGTRIDGSIPQPEVSRCS